MTFLLYVTANGQAQFLVQGSSLSQGGNLQLTNAQLQQAVQQQQQQQQQQATVQLSAQQQATLSAQVSVVLLIGVGLG